MALLIGVKQSFLLVEAESSPVTRPSIELDELLECTGGLVVEDTAAAVDRAFEATTSGLGVVEAVWMRIGAGYGLRTGVRDVTLTAEMPQCLHTDAHEKYLKQYANDDSGTEQIMAEYLKMSGMYWGLNALKIIRRIDDDAPEISRSLEFIRRCQNSDGGFGAAPKHDSHILHTLSAVQMLVILKKCNSDYIDKVKCIEYIQSLQQPDGSFFGDKWGEVDTRFTFCALATVRLLKRDDSVNIDKAVDFVMRCYNEIDGGFGSKPGSESHSAYVYCCVGSLAIAGRLNLIDAHHLGTWLSERQLPSGGMNGRPEKLPDLCYSWWCLASLMMIGKMHLIDHKKLLNFIMACQDKEQGGFSDRPGNMVDPYHTMFGLASVSLIAHYHGSVKKKNEVTVDSDLDKYIDCFIAVDPVLCMPSKV